MDTKTCINSKSTENLKNFVSFEEIGGLSQHIKTLKELIIFPLLYQNVYDKFKIRPPRGVLFYGPPGTGKTLIAGALAKECSREINGKVKFFNRKGADVLNKWVGESEGTLRTLFTEAADNQPSIIFFDEIDGLAPRRSSKNDQVHASIVTTLLSLMDGLDKLTGVVVIGATNRIDEIDPALRRPGRFDRELYFPLPPYNARREILDVYVHHWSVKPKATFLSYLADVTTGYSGSDLQALCCEAVMACLRRNYPEIHHEKINIKMKDLKVSDSDFILARTRIMPSTHREACPMQRLSAIIQPLLQRQLNQILMELRTMYPHFTQPDYKYSIGSKRYSGRLLIIGNPNQGHNTHLAPAILQALEHLPSYIIDIQALYKCANRSAEEICVQQLTQAKMNLPSIVLAYRLDEWWDIVEESTRVILISMLKDFHAGLPVFIIATVTNDLPTCLTHFFSESCSILHIMEDPDEEERRNFFHPLFMENALNKCKNSTKSSCKTAPTNRSPTKKIVTRSKRKSSFPDVSIPTKIRKFCKDNLQQISSTSISTQKQSGWFPLFNFGKKIQKSLTDTNVVQWEKGKNDESHILDDSFSNEDLEIPETSTRKKISINTIKKIRQRQLTRTCLNDLIIPSNSRTSNVQSLHFLHQHTVSVTKQMSLLQLELLYDMLATCINEESQDVPTLLNSIITTLHNFETNQTILNV